jgi:hypothetical protein
LAKQSQDESRAVLIPGESLGVNTMKPFTIRGGRHTTVERYGYEFIAARARRGMLAKELAKVLHPEKLTPDEIEAIRRQLMVRQAAVMRAAQAAKRAARQVAGQPAENEQ